MDGRDRRSLTIKSGAVRSEGVSFFSRVIFGHWICQRILREYASGLICVLSEGGGWVGGGGGVRIHPCAAYCVRGSCRWNEHRREGGRPVGKSFPWEQGAGDITGDGGVSESQERRWSKLSLSSCSFLLKV